MALGAMDPSSNLGCPIKLSSKESLIKEAITRELLRGGQVFFLHNRVETIQRIAEELNKLIPEARIAVAHGQMHERELEQVNLEYQNAIGPSTRAAQELRARLGQLRVRLAQERTTESYQAPPPLPREPELTPIESRPERPAPYGTLNSPF